MTDATARLDDGVLSGNPLNLVHRGAALDMSKQARMAER
jgi:hypothetical protein